MMAAETAPPQAALDPHERIGRCLALIAVGRCAEARALLSGGAQDERSPAEMRDILERRVVRLEDLDGAEREIRAAIGRERRDPALLTALGEILGAKGAWKEAERTLRGALALNRSSAPATVALARLLLSLGRPAEALQVTTPLTLRPDAPAEVLHAQACALRAMGKAEDASVVAERAVRVAAGTRR